MERRRQIERLSAQRTSAALLGRELHVARHGGDQEQVVGNEKGCLPVGRLIWNSVWTVSRNVRLPEAFV